MVVTKVLGFQPKKLFEDPPPPPELCNFRAEKGGILKNLSQGSETLDMTSEGYVEMFEGNFRRHVRRKISARVYGGTSGHINHAQKGSEEPHRRKRNYNYSSG